jgi:hypothetical protein
MPIIDWSIRLQGHPYVIQSAWADFGPFRVKPRSLTEKLSLAVELYPCNLLFVHRDCETSSVAARQQEISNAVLSAFPKEKDRPVVCVVPQRMTEAWLLLDEDVIRQASGNPRGRSPLSIPKLKDLEKLPDPKDKLFSLLKTASELQGRRLRNLNVHRMVHRVSELIDDFSPLKNLPAFSEFEKQLVGALKSL